LSKPQLKGRLLKRIITLVLAGFLAVGAVTSLAACSAEPINMSQVTAVIDVRSGEEYMSGHLEGAINMDVESANFAEQISTLDKNGSYVVYCHSGRRAGIALDTMKAAGFTNVVNAGGYQDASNATKLPIVQ
jgi:rhodanese-related sulfurtransferase